MSNYVDRTDIRSSVSKVHGGTIVESVAELLTYADEPEESSTLSIERVAVMSITEVFISLGKPISCANTVGQPTRVV